MLRPVSVVPVPDYRERIEIQLRKRAKQIVYEGASRCEECGGGRVRGERVREGAGHALANSGLTRSVGKGGVGVNGFGQMRGQGRKAGV
jgi:hypothetical protein